MKKTSIVFYMFYVCLTSWGEVWYGSQAQANGFTWAYDINDDKSTVTIQYKYSSYVGGRSFYKLAVTKDRFYSGYYDLTGPYDLTVPSFLGGYTVTAIGNSALSGNYWHNVTIPKGVASISESAFANCHSLTNISLPSSLISIGSSAFSECTSLTNVCLPNDIGTLSIGPNAFNVITEVKVNNAIGHVLSWTNNQGEVVLDPFHSASAVTVSPWWRKIAIVSFDANGGTGEMVDQSVLEGDALSLITNTFTRTGYDFLGWGLSANGGDGGESVGEHEWNDSLCQVETSCADSCSFRGHNIC